jgi:hypothetical protein
VLQLVGWNGPRLSGLSRVLKADEEHKKQRDERQRRADFASTAEISRFKVRVMNFRQGTLFLPGTLARETVGNNTHAWLPKAATRL